MGDEVQDANLPERQDKKMPMAEIARMAKAAADAGYSKSAGSAGVQLATAQSLGLSPMAGLFSIYEVKGKPMLSSKLLLGLINNSENLDYEWKELTDEKATIVLFRKSKRDGAWRELGRVTFTMAEAKSSGLTSNPTWKSHPKRMLAYRATSAAVSLYCPEVAMDLPVGEPSYEDYTPPRADIGPQTPLPEDTGAVEQVHVPEAEPEVLLPDEVTDPEEITDAVDVVEVATVEPGTGEVITTAQARRLWATAREAIPSDTEETVKRIVQWLCKVDSTKSIPKQSYEVLIEVIQNWPAAEADLLRAEKM